MPEMAVQSPFGNPRTLAVRPFTRPVPLRHVGAVWRKSSARVPAIEAVCDAIVKTRKD